MSKTDIREWIRITLAFGPANFKKWQYIDRKNPAESMLKLLSVERFANDSYLRAYKSVSDAQIDTVLDVCERNEIEFLTPESEDFPEALLELANPPSLLFVKGNAECMSDWTVGIVGARNCCEYSQNAAYEFGSYLAEKNLVVVSGFARGIDSAAHSGALDANGKTIAVLGSGILYDYPKGTMDIKNRIAENGAVVSEYMPTANPIADNFKIRNRLLTALSDAVLIVEASAKSGALNTANHAAEQGREVFVIPPADIFNPLFAGQAGLLHDGAQLALTPEDIEMYINDLKGMGY
ncbi:MAG: DNA-processing protein DprA [Ruminococcus sp.]|nr:DNA-processing protein DprA [Ruminococcus sp.]